MTDSAVSIVALDDQAIGRAQALANRLALSLTALQPEATQLWLSEQGLALKVPEFKQAFSIDFSSGKYDHRRKFGGGRGQPLARAVGLKQGQSPSVIDATAGFARDAFVLASLGCEVTMIEQNRIMSLLIEDALIRAADDAAIAEIAACMKLYQGNAIALLAEGKLQADVIYLDPMYPGRDKSALVKKEMQLLHQLVGADIDSGELLAIAREKAGKRVVVKRPKGAEFVGEKKPAASVQSKNTRFDIYPTR
ncbi:class I SAM-dependent methyltransferase [Methylophaga sp. OBS1]|nr:class I SAM-dependent methyltransferase [Methylophaga sp. OBS1]